MGGDDYYDHLYDYGIRFIDTTYGRTLAAGGPALITISDRYGSIAEESETAAIAVPITDLIKQKPRKLRKQTRHITKNNFAHPSICVCCPTPVEEFAEFGDSEMITFYHHEESATEDAAASEVLYPYDLISLGSTFMVPSRNPNLPRTASRRSSLSGASHAQGHGLELCTGASHAQGHGGAPQLLGRFQADDSWISPVSRGGAPVSFQNEITTESLITEEEWDSELDCEGDIEPTEGLTDSDPDSGQDVTHRKWGGKACTSPSVTSPKLSTRIVPSTSLSTSSSQCSAEAAATRAGQCSAALADKGLLQGASTSPTSATPERATVQLRSPANGKGRPG